MKVWITRDKIYPGWSSGDVCIWPENVVDLGLEDDMYCTNDDDVSTPEFQGSAIQAKSIFGFTPRKGSCKQYELTLEEA